MNPFLYFALALFLTLAIESALAAVLCGKKLLMPVVLGNIITNPLLNLILTLALIFSGQTAYRILLPVLETAAAAAEGLLIHAFVPEYTIKRSLFLSILLNALSFSLGFVLKAVL